MRSRAPAALAAAAFALTAAAAVWFVRAESTPPSFDESWYLEVSFRMFHALRGHGLLAFLREYGAAFRFKAPLVCVLPLPLYALHGPSYRAAVLMNLPALALLAASLYGLGRKLFSPAAGGLAAAFGLSMPMTVALSRTFFVETWLSALCAAFLWRWAESEALRREDEAPRLGALLGLGLLAKVLFPMTVLAPAALSLWERRPRLAALERPFKLMAVIAVPVALTWYGPNLLYVAGYMFRASVGDVAKDYGSTHVLSPSVFLPYWNTLARETSSYYIFFLTLGLLVGLGRRAWREQGIRFAAVWVLVPIAITTLGVGKDTRFIAPALPGAALLLAGTLDLATRGRRGRALLLAAALLPPLDLLALQTVGHSVLGPQCLGPVGLVVARTQFGGAPRRQGLWGQEELVRALARRLKGPAVVAVGAEHPFLNANLLSAWAARDSLPLKFIHYGDMERRVERAVARLSEKDATHILFIDGLRSNELPPMVPGVDAALRDLIARGRLPFRDAGPVPIGGGLKAELWERTGVIRMVGIIGR